tara:strand:- start:4615 stop:5577 length:963 start_codon:yes stop_codon:yes gene_type:complete
MIITEQRLLQIILEEIENIENEQTLKQLYLKKFSEHQISENLLEGRDWFMMGTTAAAVGMGLALVSAVNSDNAERKAYWAAKAAEADAKLASQDYKLGEMNKQLTNFNAWTWTDDKDPQSREMFPTIQFEQLPGQVFSVMPPEYAVFLQVKKDKEAGTFRYGVPESVQDVKDIANAITKADTELRDEAEQARLGFTQEFSDPALYDLLSSEVKGVAGVGGQVYLNSDGNMVNMRSIVPDFEDLENYYSGPLPLTGVSVKELYNNFMFGNYFSSEEGEMVADYLEFDIDTEINPELIDKTNQRAAQDIEKLRARRNEEKNA